MGGVDTGLVPVAAIYNDKELRLLTASIVPRFSYLVVLDPSLKKFKLPKNKISYPGGASEEFKLGLQDLLSALVVYYGDQITHANQLDVARTAISQKSKSLFQDIMRAVHTNPDLQRIPWDDVFNKVDSQREAIQTVSDPFQ